MRDHFKALLGTMLALHAVTAAAAVVEDRDSTALSIDHVRLVEPAAVDIHSMFESSTVNSALLASARTRSATAEVMNLPAEPIPTPPAFAMGMTVIVGLMGYKVSRKAYRRLLAA